MAACHLTISRSAILSSCCPPTTLAMRRDDERETRGLKCDLMEGQFIVAYIFILCTSEYVVRFVSGHGRPAGTMNILQVLDEC